MTNNWLKARAELYAKYAAECPICSTVHFEYSKPEYGWITMKVCVNKDWDKCVELELSNVVEPFVPFVKWLKSILENRYTGASVLKVDSEMCPSYSFILYFEPILFCEDWNTDTEPHPSNCGIFYIYDNDKQAIVCDAYCEINDFVRQKFIELKHYAKAMKREPTFVEHWVEGAYNEEWSACKSKAEEVALFGKMIDHEHLY